MHVLTRSTSRVRASLVAAAMAVIALVALMLGPLSPSARASSDGSNVSGNFAFSGSVLIGCPTGALLCTRGTITGGVNGSFTLKLLSTLPAPDPGIFYFTGLLAVHTATGNLNCTLDGAENASSSSDGAFGEICVISSGTGTYANAKGDLRMIGTSTSKLLIPTGAGSYVGTVTTS